MTNASGRAFAATTSCGWRVFAMAGRSPILTHGFLFADLRDYTGYVERRGDLAAAELLGRFRALVRTAVTETDGAEIRTEGDSVFVVFDSASGAVRCGLAISAAAADSGLADAAGVGVGVHAGEAVETAEGLVGSAVNIAARLCAMAQPGDVLASEAVRLITRTYLRVEFVPLGRRHLKGVTEPVGVYRVVVPEASSGPTGRRQGSRVRRTRLLAAGVAALALIAVAAVGLSAPRRGGAAGATASPFASSGMVATQPASPPPSAPAVSASTPPTDGFPNAAERALLAKLDVVPGQLARTCKRGPYVTKASGPLHGPGPIPVASLDCSPGVSSGASDVIVQQFTPGFSEANFARAFIQGLVDDAICRVPGQCGTYMGGWSFDHIKVIPIPAGDCAVSRSAHGSWDVAGAVRGEIACHLDAETGDALLDWTYDQDGLLVQARNARGDSSSLYGFFRRVARFIGS